MSRLNSSTYMLSPNARASANGDSCCASSNGAQRLLHAATQARDKAYCPYSGFAVGAAIRTLDGTIFTGVNVENASYGGTICAERSALVRAVTAGHREFEQVAIVTNLEGQFAYPCGLCRQTLIEFGDMEVIVASAHDYRSNCHRLPLSDLLPHAFTPADLQAHGEQHSRRR